LPIFVYPYVKSTTYNFVLLLVLLWTGCKKEKPLNAAEVSLDLFRVTGVDYASDGLDIDQQTLIPVSSRSASNTWRTTLLRFGLGGKLIADKQLDFGNAAQSVISINYEANKLLLCGQYENNPAFWIMDSSASEPQINTVLDTAGRLFDGIFFSGHFYFAGETRAPNGKLDILVLKVSTSGQLIDQQRFGSDENDGGIHWAIFDGRLVLLAYTYADTDFDRDISVCHIDADLNIQFQKSYKFPKYEQPQRLLAQNDRLLVFAHSTSGNSNSHDALILSLDKSFNLQTKKFISLGSHEGVDDIRVLKNGNIGLVSYGDMDISSGLYMEIDQNLILHHQKRYPDIAGYFYMSEFNERRVFWGQTRGPDLQLARVSDTF